MTAESVVIRAGLIVVVVITCAIFAPLLVLMKVLEGVLVATTVTKDCIRQAWRCPPPQ